MSQSTRFKQTELGEIPEEWEVRELKEILSLSQSGIWGSEPDWSEDVFPVIRSTEIDQDGKLHLDSPSLAWRKVPKHRAVNYALRDGDILVVKSSGSRHLLGRVTYFKQQGEKVFLFSNFLHRLRAIEGVCTSLFLYYVLTSPIAKRTLEALQETTSGLRNLPIDEYLQMLIPLPPLEEQKRIAGVLRLVDEIIERTRQIVSLYEKAKKYALSHLLTKGIGHTRFKQTELGEIPEEWEVKRLEEVTARVYSGSSAPQEQKYFEGGIYPFVRVQDLARYGQTRNLVETADKVNDMAVRELSLVLAPRGTIVFPKSGAALEKNHRAILGTDAYIVSHLAAVEINHEVADTEFVFWWLCNVDMAAINPNPGYPSIRLQEIKALSIPLPPLEEQKRIAEILSTIDKAIDNERRYLEALGKLKKWLLNNLLTGKVRLPEWVGDILKQVFPEG